jgi:hypothetical protein
MVKESRLEAFAREFCKDYSIKLTKKEPSDGSDYYWIVGENNINRCSYSKNEQRLPNIESVSFAMGDINKILVSGLLDDTLKNYNVQFMVEVDSYQKEIAKLKPVEVKKDLPIELSNLLLSQLNQEGLPTKQPGTALCYIVGGARCESMDELKNLVYNQMK